MLPLQVDLLFHRLKKNANVIANPNTNNTGIHNGAVTHHQLQSMSPVNFNVMNIKNRIIPKPKPFDVFFLSLILIFFN
jgi:hypothetical protein